MEQSSINQGISLCYVWLPEELFIFSVHEKRPFLFGLVATGSVKDMSTRPIIHPKNIRRNWHFSQREPFSPTPTVRNKNYTLAASKNINTTMLFLVQLSLFSMDRTMVITSNLVGKSKKSIWFSMSCPSKRYPFFGIASHGDHYHFSCNFNIVSCMEILESQVHCSDI